MQDTRFDSDQMPGFTRTLEFLKSHSTEYISGRDLGDVIGISRVAVWKHVKTLRSLGYEIESVQKTGYRLLGTPDEPYPWEIAHNAGVIGRKIIYYTNVDSTQDAAAALGRRANIRNDGRENADDNYNNNGAVIIAAQQTAGRGRAGKKWISPKGGIWMSIVLHPPCIAAGAATLFPIGAGAAVAHAIRDTCGIKTELRWPNDITVRGSKIAGIITEAELEGSSIQVIRAGIGINFDPDIDAITQSITGTHNFYGATSITAECNRGGISHPSKTALVSAVIDRMNHMYEMLLARRLRAIAAQWSRIPSTIGVRVEATVNGRKITAGPCA